MGGGEVRPVGVGFCCVVCFNHYYLGFRRADSFGGAFSFPHLFLSLSTWMLCFVVVVLCI